MNKLRILSLGFTVMYLIFITTSSYGQTVWDNDPHNLRVVSGTTQSDFNHIPKRIGHYTRENWQGFIDSTWGPGLPTAEKLVLFDEAWNTFNAEYAAFQNLDVNLDSLWVLYRPEIEAGVSRGRFAAIMNQLSLAFNEMHTFIIDLSVNQTTPLEPGVPLFVVGARENESHFGASLTPLPDSTLLVYNVLPDHPLDLIPGDIVLGYDGILWKVLYHELLEAELPLYNIRHLRSTESANTHGFLMSAGWNWHLFDTLDVVKYATGDTMHYATAALAGQSGFIWGNEQLPIPGVPWLDIGSGEDIQYVYELGDYVSWGIVEGTQIGYIYVVSWNPPWQADLEAEFLDALDNLMNIHETSGLILDYRLNYGGKVTTGYSGLSLLFNSNIETIRYDQRCGDPNNHFEMCDHPLWTAEYLAIPGDPGSFYDKPIAVLTGPGGGSMGDINPLRMKSHPMTRLFGKPTAGGFSGMSSTVGNLAGNSDWLYGVTHSNAIFAGDSNNYLTHTELEIDEEVWFTQEDVAQGHDTVVERAIEWIQNLAHAHDVSIDPTYAYPGTDMVTVNASVENPNNHELSVFAQIMSSDSSLIDSAYLYDDGNHADSLENDGLWGGDWQTETVEGFYSIDLTAADLTEGTSRTIPAAARFTTVGPLEIESLVQLHPAQGAIAPNTAIYFDVFLENLGAITTAEDISVHIQPADTNSTLLGGYSIAMFESIPAGEVRMGQSYLALTTSANCVEGTPIHFDVKIKSQGMTYWEDTGVLLGYVGLAESNSQIPQNYALQQNYPNPFNPATTISYALPEMSDATMTIYGLNGREVVRIANGQQATGYHNVHWGGLNSQGLGVSTGVYFCRLSAGSYSKTIKMVYLR